jgi:hypothetical protein
MSLFYPFLLPLQRTSTFASLYLIFKRENFYSFFFVSAPFLSAVFSQIFRSGKFFVWPSRPALTGRFQCLTQLQHVRIRSSQQDWIQHVFC